MKQLKPMSLILFLSLSFSACKGQKSFGMEQLVLQQRIALPGVTGRMDHMDANGKDRMLYVAALENNSLEVVDLEKGESIYSLKGIAAPQGVAYIPSTNEIVVTSGGNGRCAFYKARTFEKTASLDLGSDADDVRYDSVARILYVGYGNGGIAVIDVHTHQKKADIKLPAHPEGFQLDKQLDQLYVNLPDARKIAVIDLKTKKVVAQWPSTHRANFPMTIDEEHHVLFVGYRRPGILAAIDARTGKTIAEISLVPDTDDLFLDPYTHKLFASGGGGSVNLFSFENNRFQPVARLPVRSGARTSLLLPSLRLFILAERATGGKEAQLKVFSVRP